MIDKTRWGVAESPRFVTASGELEVVARFVTKKEATEYRRLISPQPRSKPWQFQYTVVRVAPTKGLPG